ncbi:hypothetical protein [Streptomyces resistomycificus]|uniref:hypothetical protein n=1 Tax=Streptomyces resistomycificus TaxID=67356 RepID=UPI000B02C3C9|nr:hypothetical protein [Streptomyces resistomycificus]
MSTSWPASRAFNSDILPRTTDPHSSTRPFTRAIVRSAPGISLRFDRHGPGGGAGEADALLERTLLEPQPEGALGTAEVEPAADPGAGEPQRRHGPRPRGVPAEQQSGEH